MTNPITEAERAVMEVLWQHGPLPTSDIVSRLSASREWHRNTVSTLVRRLVEKGAVGKSSGAGRTRYKALVERDNFRHREARKLVKELFDGQITPLLAGFAESETLSADDLKKLKKLVSKLAKNS